MLPLWGTVMVTSWNALAEPRPSQRENLGLLCELGAPLEWVWCLWEKSRNHVGSSVAADVETRGAGLLR